MQIHVPIITIAITCAAATAQTTYYVNDACGNDSWTGADEACTAPIGPKQTIQAALDVATIGDELKCTGYETSRPHNRTDRRVLRLYPAGSLRVEPALQKRCQVFI